MKMLENMSVVAVLLEYKQDGVDAEAVASHIKYSASQPADHPTFSVFRDARANTLVGG